MQSKMWHDLELIGGSQVPSLYLACWQWGAVFSKVCYLRKGFLCVVKSHAVMGGVRCWGRIGVEMESHHLKLTNTHRC